MPMKRYIQAALLLLSPLTWAWLLFIFVLWASCYAFRTAKVCDPLTWIFVVVGREPDGPRWWTRHWDRWRAHSGPFVVLLREVPPEGDDAWIRTLMHELEHSRQHFVWGPLMPLAYVVSGMWQLVQGKSPYRDNWFEREARRVAGQIV